LIQTLILYYSLIFLILIVLKINRETVIQFHEFIRTIKIIVRKEAIPILHLNALINARNLLPHRSPEFTVPLSAAIPKAGGGRRKVDRRPGVFADGTNWRRLQLVCE
jgi:hypothetical protein